MIVSKNSYARFEGNKEDIFTTYNREYFPVYIVENSLNRFKDIYFYTKPNINFSYHSQTKRYNVLFENLKDNLRLKIFSFKFGEVEYQLKFLKGIIYDEGGNILLCLATNNVNFTEIRNNGQIKIVPETLKLFVSTDFLKFEYYKNVFKKIQKEYIDLCYVNDIPVEFTTSEKIDKMFFSTEIEFSFNTVEEIQEHLQSGIGDLLFYEDPIEEEQSDENLDSELQNLLATFA